MENNINQQDTLPTEKPSSISKDNVSKGLKSLVNDVYRKEKEKSNLYTPEQYMGEKSVDRQALDTFFKPNDKVSMTTPVDVNEVYAEVGGDYLSRFPGYIKGTDNAERAARQQTTGEKMANGLTKAGVQLGSTVLGGTVGFVKDIENWISSGFDMDAVYTDEFNKSLDEFNEKLQFTLPNYYTKQEQDMNFGQSLGTANFWANDLPNGISFTLGAMVSEGIWAAATGGTSLASAGARWAMKAGKLGRILNKVNGSQKLTGNLIRASEKANRSVQNVKKTYNSISAANTARFMFTSAGYESGVEARQFMKESKENFENYFQETYGRGPNAQERSEFEKGLISSANAVWAGNMAVVGGSNLAVFGRMFKVTRPLLKSGNKLKSGINSRIFGIGSKTSKEGGKSAKEALTPNKLQKVAGYTQSFGKSAVIEGFWEEGNQSVIGNMADDWLSSGYEEGSARDTYDFMGGLYDSYAETYGSKEGWKEIGIGMMVGTLGGGISGQFGSYNRALKNEKVYADAINSSEFGAQATADKMMTYSRMMKANKDEQDAVERGDRTAEENARKRGILSFVANQDTYGRQDETFENFKAALELTDDATVAKENNISEQEVADYKSSVLEEFKSLQDSYTDNKRFADMILGESPSVDSKVDKSMVADAIAYNMTMGKEASDHADIFLEEFIKEVSSVLSPEQALDFKDAARLRSGLEKASKEKRVRYNNAQKTYNRLNRQKTELEKKIKSVQRKLSRVGNEQTEQKKKEKDTLLELTEKLNDLETTELPRARAEWETSSNIIITNNPFSFTEDTDSGFMVTSADRLAQLSQIDDSGNLVGGVLKNIDDSLEQLAQDNPVAYQRAQKMLTEYKRSVYAFKEFNKTIQGISNPNFKPTNLVTKLEALIAKAGGKKENDFTREFYAKVGASIIEDTEFQAAQAAKEKTETPSTTTLEGDTPGSTPSDMTQKEFKKYRDDGIVSKDRLQKIADKLKQFAKNKPDKSKTEAQVNKNKSLIEKLEKQKENLKNSKDSDLDEIDRISSDETKRDRRIREINESLNLIKSDTNYKIFSELGLNKYEQAVYLGKSKEIESLLQQEQETNEVKRLENIIKKALQKNSAIANYVGEDITQAEEKRPSKKELSEFRELHSRIKNSRFKSTSIVANANPATIKENQGDNLDLSIEEIERYQELNEKLASWQIQEGTVIDGIDATLADLIIRLQQLRTEVSLSDTKSEQTIQDFIEIVKASDRNSRTSKEDKGMVQTPTEGVYLGIEKNGQRMLSHVTAESFINKYLPKMPDSVFIKLPGKKTKQRVEDIDQLTSVQKQKGVIIYIEDAEIGNISITIGDHARLVFSKEQWDSIENQISLKFFYALGYEELSDGTIQQAKSDFTYDTSDENKRPIALEEEMYDTDTVEVFVDPKNEYNRGLLEKLEQAKRSKVESAIKEAREALVSNMSIYYMRAGKIIGEARAGTDNLPKSETSDAFLDLRKKAAQSLENTKESNLINMKTTIPIGFTYYGSPIFNLVKNEDGSVRAELRPISTRDSKVIVDAGFVQNGKLSIGGKVDQTEVLTQYLPKTSTKTPVVVFKYKGRNVAFPVSLAQKDANLVEPFNEIISNSETTDGQKVNEINDFFIRNGISPSEYNLKESDLTDINTVEAIQERLSQFKTFADVDAWTQEGFNLSRLRIDALTSIDLAGKPFNLPKLKLALSKKESELEYDEEGTIIEISPEKIPEEELDEFDALMNGEAQKRRDAGSYTKYGNTYTRQKEDVTTENSKGKESNVKFADKVVQETEYTLVEEKDLQPAHMGGYRNPNFFITEAQPKNRTDDVSKRQSDNISNNPTFGELGESGIAYTGAPVINQRGEVIQGNNRSEGLKKHYREGKTQYKEDLADNASNFGFSRKQVEDMDRPVLVRVAKVEDKKSIELGNYEMADIETGGRARINPITTTKRIPRVAKRAITSALFRDNPDQTLNSAIRNNFDAVMNTLKNYLTDTQIDSLVDKEGNIRTEGAKDLENLIQHFLYSEGDSNLPSMFEEMSGTARNGIIKSLPKILDLQPSKSIIKNIQNSIILYNTFVNSGVSDFNSWKNQVDIFEGKTTTDGFSELDLKIAESLLSSRTESEIKRLFAKYESEANGVKADMFGTSTEPKSKEEAVKNTFGVELEEEQTEIELGKGISKEVKDNLGEVCN